MKQNFISREKLSKKAQRTEHAKLRNTWQINPVTRVADTNNRKYRRHPKHKGSEGWC